jgi:hypothetical protein
MGFADRTDQFHVSRPLRDVARRPGVEGCQGVVLLLGRGQHEDPGLGMRRAQLLEHGEAVQPRQCQVEKHEVGAVPAPEWDDVLAAGRAGHHLEIPLAGERIGQALEEDRVVIHEHQADGARRVWRSVRGDPSSHAR